ncbi:MAG: prefoldin subunit, partial [Prevotellaceae bacterium]|nr:prefoldin subunit [Prevotellaceae bacterium]
MRKITVIFSVLVLCSVSAFAQKTISKDDFEHLVDYANCQYLMAFIEKNASKSYIKDTYEKKVKPILQKATLDDLTKVPTIDTINNLFSIDSIDSIDSNDKALSNLLKSAKGLAETINKRKGNYDYSPDNNSLVDELNAKIWSNVDLKNTATKIKNDVRKKYQLGSIKETSSTPCFLIFISFVVGILFGLVLKSLICKFVKQIYRGLKEGRGSSGKKEENNGGANNGNNTTKNDLVDELKADIERKDKEIKALTKQKVCLETKLTQKNKKIKEMNGKQTIPHQQAPQQTNNAPQQANNNPPQDSSLYFASKYDKTL